MAPKMTHTGMVFGTPAFMAPEQASGRLSKIDAQTDIWAVGATMFTLVSGALVHQGETAQHVVVLAATQRARSLKSVLPAAEEPLVSVIDRALSLEKKKRWPSADALADAIREASLMLFGEAEPDLLEVGELTRVQVFVSPPPFAEKPRRRTGASSDTADYYPIHSERADALEEFARKVDGSDTEKNALPRAYLDSTAKMPPPDLAALAKLPAPIESSDEDDALTRVRKSSPELNTTASLPQPASRTAPLRRALVRPAATPGWGSPRVTPGQARPVSPTPGDVLATLRSFLRRVGGLGRPGTQGFDETHGSSSLAVWRWVGLGSLAFSIFVVAIVIGLLLTRSSRRTSASASTSLEPESHVRTSAARAAGSAAPADVKPAGEVAHGVCGRVCTASDRCVGAVRGRPDHPAPGEPLRRRRACPCEPLPSTQAAMRLLPRRPATPVLRHPSHASLLGPPRDRCRRVCLPNGGPRIGSDLRRRAGRRASRPR
jgi:hypothetical protein